MPEGLALALYATALRLLTPFYLLRLWRRGAKEALYRFAMGERLGFYGAAAEAGRLWIHAVSLGETRAASALIDALRARDPALKFLLTHSTATGRDAGQPLLREGDAQAWLRNRGYQPTDLHLSAMTRLGGRMTQANIAFDDHPSARRFSSHIDTVTVDSMFAWLPRAGLSQSPQLVQQ